MELSLTKLHLNSRLVLRVIEEREGVDEFGCCHFLKVKVKESWLLTKPTFFVILQK